MPSEPKGSDWTLDQIQDFSEALLGIVCSEVLVMSHKDFTTNVELEEDLLLARVTIDGRVKATVMGIEMLEYLWSFDHIYPIMMEESLVLFCSQGGAFFHTSDPDGLISTIHFSEDQNLLKVFDA